MIWTTPEEVLVRWQAGANKPLATDERFIAFIDDAETLILQAFPRINERIVNGLLDIKILKMVIYRMVSSAYAREQQGNKVSYNRSIAGMSEGVTFGSVEKSPNGVALTAEDIKMLAPRGVSRAFTIDLAPNASVAYDFIDDYIIPIEW